MFQGATKENVSTEIGTLREADKALPLQCMFENSVKRSNFWSCTFYPCMYFHFHSRVKPSVGKMTVFQWFFFPNKITAVIKLAFCPAEVLE